MLLVSYDDPDNHFNTSITESDKSAWFESLTPLVVTVCKKLTEFLGASLTRNGPLAPVDPFPGHADPGLFRLAYVFTILHNVVLYFFITLIVTDMTEYQTLIL